MQLALDVHYKETYAKAVGVLFNWQDAAPEHVFTSSINDTAEYIPGQFYKRELPCLLPIIEQVIPIEIQIRTKQNGIMPMDYLSDQIFWSATKIQSVQKQIQ